MKYIKEKINGYNTKKLTKKEIKKWKKLIKDIIINTNLGIPKNLLLGENYED